MDVCNFAPWYSSGGDTSSHMGALIGYDQLRITSPTIDRNIIRFGAPSTIEEGDAFIKAHQADHQAASNIRYASPSLTGLRCTSAWISLQLFWRNDSHHYGSIGCCIAVHLSTDKGATA